jgi:hypothetical protein
MIRFLIRKGRRRKLKKILADVELPFRDRVAICGVWVRRWDKLNLSGHCYRAYHLYYSCLFAGLVNRYLELDDEVMVINLAEYCVRDEGYSQISFIVKNNRNGRTWTI